MYEFENKGTKKRIIIRIIKSIMNFMIEIESLIILY